MGYAKSVESHFADPCHLTAASCEEWCIINVSVVSVFGMRALKGRMKNSFARKGLTGVWLTLVIILRKMTSSSLTCRPDSGVKGSKKDWASMKNRLCHVAGGCKMKDAARLNKALKRTISRKAKASFDALPKKPGSSGHLFQADRRRAPGAKNKTDKKPFAKSAGQWLRRHQP